VISMLTISEMDCYEVVKRKNCDMIEILRTTKMQFSHGRDCGKLARTLEEKSSESATEDTNYSTTPPL